MPAWARVLGLALLLASGARAEVQTWGDWDLGCDNVGDCMAVGYPPEDLAAEAPRAALRLLRAAGPGRPLRLEWQAETGGAQNRSVEGPLALRAGALRLRVASHELAATDSQRLLRAMLEAPELSLRQGGLRWSVSLQGLMAALLRMDELQGRLDTPGAAVRRGARPESDVPAARPLPRLRVVGTAHREPPAAQAAAIWQRLRALSPACWEDVPEALSPSAELRALGPGLWLAWRECSRGAYQSGYGLWRVDARPPHAAQALSLPGLPGEAPEALPAEIDFEAGRLHSQQKLRGVGDCLLTRSWVWDGREFRLAAAANSGSCRGFVGGAWMIPLWRSELLR